MSDVVLAIDQGTTGTTALLLDTNLNTLAKFNQEFRQIFPRPGWVEHDAEDIWASVEATVTGVLARAGVGADRIAAIGITNQRETTVLWDRASSRPVHNAIVWQCRRTTDRCEALREAGHEAAVRQTTGLVLDPYFSGTKLAWLLDEVDGARERAARGDLAFGTIDTFLTWRLTGGAAHVTDASNASRTLLMDLRSMAWDEGMLELLRVPRQVLPEIRGCSEIYGRTRGLSFLPDGIPVAGMAGDQQSALFGQAAFAPGEAKCTYGTGAFLLLNTGDRVVYSDNGMLTTVAWKLGDEVTYALEGSVFIAGAAVQWLRDGLNILGAAPEIEAMAESVPDSGGVVFVPALAGLGAPHWRASARGAILGIDRGTTRAHLARATLEGIALQIVDILQAMETDLDASLRLLRVDGGAAANDLLMQLQSDLLDVPIVRPRMLETTAAGAAMLAGLATGVWSDLEQVGSAWQEDRRFSPSMSRERAQEMMAAWEAAVEKA
jgi:glycerol kinase